MQKKSSSDQYQEYKKKIQQLLKATRQDKLPQYTTHEEDKISMEEEILRRESLKNNALEQDIQLKRNTLVILFRFLALETVAVFLLTCFQATAFSGFHLEEWSFKLLVTATVLQITFMLNIAVKHLFPQKNTEYEKK